MQKRWMSLWFRHLLADWQVLRRPELNDLPFVFAAPDHGRFLVTATNLSAEQYGVVIGMTIADAKAITPGLEVLDDKPGRSEKLLRLIGEWGIRYTPFVAVDPPDGLLLDISGCSHLWKDERGYYKEVINCLRDKGYDVRGAIADTAACAWAVARFAKSSPITPSGKQAQAIYPLHPAALRLEGETLELLHQLGMFTIAAIARIPQRDLKRRLGEPLLNRLGRAIGTITENIEPIRQLPPYSEHLPCLEPISRREDIETALSCLLEKLCKRLSGEHNGIRSASLKYFKIDGETGLIAIGTKRPSHHMGHLFKLFELKIGDIQPDLGIELFVLEASKVDELPPGQSLLWSGKPGLENEAIAELLDRIAGKVGQQCIHRYVPAEHHWPERCYQNAQSIGQHALTTWFTDKPRPFRLLPEPQEIIALAAEPDYPPKVFIYRGDRHDIIRADGPERIEQEWWLADGKHRDYYVVEDSAGRRYWLFRYGYYDNGQNARWYLHGYFA